MEHRGEKEIFRVDRHLLYASHASTATHWEQWKVAVAVRKAAKPKKKPNPKPGPDPPPRPALSPQSLTPTLRLSKP